MKHINKAVCLYSLAIIAIAIAFYHICNRTYQTIEELVSDAFDVAVISDLDLREKKAGLFFRQGYHYESGTEPHSFLEKRQKEQTVHKKTDTFQLLSVNEKITVIKQSYLLGQNPIKVSVLDSFFRAELEKRNIAAPITVSCSNNLTKEIICFPIDPDAFRKRSGISRCLMIRRTTGLHDEITLQGFVRVSPATVFRNVPRSFIFLFIGLCAVTGLLISAILCRKKKRSASLSVPETPEIPPVIDAGPPEPPFSLNPIDQTFSCQGKTIRLTRDMFLLFEAIWNSEQHFASYEDLCKILYPKMDMRTGKHRLFQLLCELRKTLDWQDAVIIENVSRKGYRIALSDAK
jgi:hypothetical protein